MTSKFNEPLQFPLQTTSSHLHMEKEVSAGFYKRNVLLLTPEYVTRRNGKVYTPSLGELSRLRRSMQFKNGVVFADKMSAEDVKRRLEEAFPVLSSKR